MGTRASFGEQLRRYREAAGLSQEALAERAGLTTNAIGALERGLRKRPFPHTIGALADALGLEKAERAALAALVERQSTAAPAPARAPTPPSASPQSAVVGLPGHLTTLIGRERECAAVIHLLGQPEIRLLTLTGSGGIGKTRLALAVAREARSQFSGGVAFVPLAGVNSPVLIMRTIARTVLPQEDNEASLHEALVAALRERAFLLILDNFEHLLDAAPEIAQLLLDCPQLTILVTSRAALRVGGEQEYQVPPLELPVSTARADLASIREVASIRLFVDRARAVRPDFALTPGNSEAIGAICARLEGIPLALELAAARSQLFPPTALLAQLERGLGVLTGGPRDLPARQRTMRDAIAWSYDLLSSEEQGFFRRLSVFAGGWTLEAAEQVCGDQSGAFLDLLASLVEKSLVVAEIDRADETGEARYRFLEPVRHYAADRLRESGEAADSYQRHAAWARAVAAESFIRLRGAGQIRWLDRLEIELDNVRAALTWSIEHGQPSQAVELATDLDRFWHYRAHQSEGRRWLQRGLAACGETITPQLRARALNLVGYLTFFQGDLARAGEAFAESAAICRATDDDSSLGAALDGLADIAYVERDYPRARHLQTENLRLRRALGDQWGLAMATMGLGLVALGEGAAASARTLLEESLVRCREVGDPRGIATILLLLGWVAVAEGDADRVITILLESLDLFRAARNPVGIVECLEGLACAAGLRARPLVAAHLAGAASALRATMRVSISPNIGRYERHLALARDQVAAIAWDAAYAAGQRDNQDEASAVAHSLSAALADGR